MSEESLKSLKEQYETLVGSQLTQLSTSISTIARDMAEIKLSLASYNLAEIKQDVASARNLLMKYDLSWIHETVLKHDKTITKATTIVIVVQVIIGLALAILNYLKH